MDDKAVLCITDKGTDPYWNLAAEEYLLKNFPNPVFRLWRNSDSVIIGQNQNALAEINREWVVSHGIPVVRRLTGGGAVFHDLGNVNFTFIGSKAHGEDTLAIFRRFTRPVIDTLWKDRVLCHGCILFDTSVGHLSEALKSRPEKFIGKAVSSNRSRVTNICEHLPSPMDIGTFISRLKDTALADRQALSDSGIEAYAFTAADTEAIDRLVKEKYGLDSWNYGRSPKYSISRVRRFPTGLVEIYADISSGKISGISIMGDYFFEAPTEELEAVLTDCPYDKAYIADALRHAGLDRYIAGISPEQIADMMF